MRGWVAGLAVTLLSANAIGVADDLPREVLLLARFKPVIREILSHLPDYTCLETIQRYGFERHGVDFKPLDTVEVEVSTVGKQELVAWPGATRFDETPATLFGAGGMTSTGLFATHARVVFLSDTTIVRYHGQERIDDNLAERYDFRVPQVWSGYKVSSYGVTALVGTHGSFWIDPESLELLRLEVQPDQLPPELYLRSSTTDIDYARMRVAASDVLLPQTARVITTLESGDVLRNNIEFSHCRAYAAESAIRFDMPETAPAAVTATRHIDLPARLDVTIELETAIDPATAKVGQPIRGHLVADVRRKGKLIVPKGAVATGRIRAFARLRPPETGVELTLEFVELEWEGAHAEFYAEMVDSASIRNADDVAAKPRRLIPGTGVVKTRGRLAPGYKMTWHTIQPNSRSGVGRPAKVGRITV